MKNSPFLNHPLSEYFARMAMDLKNARRLYMGQHGLRIETEIRQTIAREIGKVRSTCGAGVVVCLARHIAQRDGLPWLSFDEHVEAAMEKIIRAESRAREGAQ